MEHESRRRMRRMGLRVSLYTRDVLRKWLREVYQRRGEGDYSG
jgi:hypothetical protein